ncbi:MAG: tyrosine-type recombinase/integrase [Fuerstiella sp.]
MAKIRVGVIKHSNRKNLYLRYTDPVTGKRHERNSGTTGRRAAERAAGEWQNELNTVGVAVGGELSWNDFREDFFEHYIDHRSKSYSDNVSATFNVIERKMKPDKLSRVTTAWIKRFKTQLVRDGRPTATIHKYMQHLGTALKWAWEQEYIKTIPRFPAEKRNAAKGKKHMKGRPITLEEFERMLDACEYASLRYLLNGLWLSGLRIGEALALTWDQWADGIRILVEDGNVYLLIDAEDQKNRETVLYPVVDEFAAFLLETPQEDRQGFVFNPRRSRGAVSRRVDTVSDWIVKIGEAAGVKVDINKKRVDGKLQDVVSWASAHDLRRSFGNRWAQVFPPMVLRDLMRHASVETTEKYYVGINARKTVETMRQYQQDVKDLAD